MAERIISRLEEIIAMPALKEFCVRKGVAVNDDSRLRDLIGEREMQIIMEGAARHAAVIQSLIHDAVSKIVSEALLVSTTD